MLRIWTTIILFGLCCGCASSLSEQPLYNARPDGEVYPYGASGDVVATKGEPSPKRGSSPFKLPQKPKQEELVKKQAEKAEPAHAAEAAEKDLPPVDFAGEYLGFDEVLIRMELFPEQKQRDDAAIMRVESDGEFQKAIVVDTRDGHELCALRGKPAGSKLLFEPGQQCFSGLMGAPIEATLKAGSAHLEGEQLTADFEVELELASPNGSITGILTYHFEGSR